MREKREDLSPGESVIYRIDKEDRIIEVNKEWNSFAMANNGLELLRSKVLERPIWDFISGSTTAKLYKRIFKRVREKSPSISFDYRCDSPNRERHMKMKIELQPLGDMVFESSIIKVVERNPEPFFSRRVRGSHKLVYVCSLCDLIRESGDFAWLTLREALDNGMVMNRAEPNQVAYSICPSCSKIGSVDFGKAV